jgi:hypothetical protein
MAPEGNLDRGAKSRLGERPQVELGGIRAGAHAFRSKTTVETWEITSFQHARARGVI